MGGLAGVETEREVEGGGREEIRREKRKEKEIKEKSDVVFHEV
jgi:hypothetical protein